MRDGGRRTEVFEFGIWNAECGLKEGEGRWMRDDGRRRLKVRSSEAQKVRRKEGRDQRTEVEGQKLGKGLIG
jgi:hypothetical protein